MNPGLLVPLGLRRNDALKNTPFEKRVLPRKIDTIMPLSGGIPLHAKPLLDVEFGDCCRVTIVDTAADDHIGSIRQSGLLDKRYFADDFL
jgi:hypothetical protein